MSPQKWKLSWQSKGTADVSRIIDISPLISPKTAVWPGDVAFQRSVAMDMKSGDNLTLSSVTTTVHIGAHTDAPNHYVVDGQAMSERTLEPYYGPCQVVRVSTARGQRIRPQDLEAPITAERVLLVTDSFPDPNVFNEDFCSLSAELVDFLGEAGVVLVGIDTPSVDLFSDKELESHNAIARRDMAILEGVVLADVPSGTYTLIALPLNIEGADASPVRAVLVDD